MFSKPFRVLILAALWASLVPVLAEAKNADSGERSALRAQVLLDRAGFSPGPIDGSNGENTRRALRAFQRREDLPETGKLSREVWEILERGDETPALVDYNISRDDTLGPFVPDIPEKLEDKAELDQLSYTSPEELLAEKFHMDIALLKSLNPKAEFDEPGTTIKVANVGERVRGKSRKVAKLEVDKKAGAVRALDDDGRLVAFYPATVGSRETPSPRGSHEVTKIAREPAYTYDPDKLDFEEVKARKKFTIAAGPNNPVGLVWIALDKEGYGIHGSPEPKGGSRQQSLGCVRLTNWDALELADLVKPGMPVEFTSASESAASDE